MSETVKRLVERRAALVKEMRDLAERAVIENRDMTAEEDAHFQRINAEVDALQRRADAILEGEERAKDIEAAFQRIDGKTPEQRQTPEGKGRTEELRAFLQGRGGREFRIDPTPGVYFRDLVKGTASAGGNTVPQGFYARLVEHLVESTALMGISNVLNTSSGETLPVPKTTAHGGAAVVAEATALAESDPTFGVVNLGAYKYGQLLQVSSELISDTGVDLEGYLARSAGRNLGLAVGPHLVTGDGSSKPRGVVTDASAGVTGPTGTATSFGTQSTAGQGGDLIIDLYHSVIAPYRNSSSCAFLLKDSTAASLRKLKNSQGDYIWQAALSVGAPDTILGKPVYTDPNVAAVAANAKSVLFGDFSQYFIRVAGPIRFERSDDFAFSSDLVTFRAVMRADAALVDLTGAVKYFAHSAT